MFDQALIQQNFDWLGVGLVPLLAETSSGELFEAISVLDVGLLVLGVVVGVVLWVGGFLGPGAFAGTPVRRSGLRAVDLVVGLVLMLLGMEVYGLLVRGVEWMAGFSEGERSLWLSYLGQVLTQFPVVLWLLWRAGRVPGGCREGWRGVGLVPGRVWRDLKVGVVGVAAGVPLVMGLVTLVVMVGLWAGVAAPAFGHPVFEVIQGGASVGVLLGHGLSAVVLAPVFEECIFRGLVQTSLLVGAGWGHRWKVIFVSSALFTLVHAGLPWQVLPGLFVLGVLLGWVYERTGSLLPAVLVHMGFNALNFFLVVLVGRL